MHSKTNNRILKNEFAAKRYFGLHFAPGVAQYQYEDGAKRVFISEATAKQMNSTFEGKPVYIGHVDKIDEQSFLQAHGYVVRSFYNEADGHHWAEFIVTDKQAQEAINKGLRLSNAYFPTDTGAGGEWHGMDYEQEILNAEYEHLAIVDDPRYAESVILTPDEFKKYNEGKKEELYKYLNQKESKKMKFNIFKKEKLKNQADYEGMVFELPESKVEKTIEELVTLADKVESGEMKNEIAMEDVVKVNEEDVTIKELVECYEAKAENETDDDEEVENEVEIEIKEEEDDDEEEIENEKDDDDEKKANSISALKKSSRTIKHKVQTIDLMHNKIDRGRARYGS